jgi:hypothetical protein
MNGGSLNTKSRLKSISQRINVNVKAQTTPQESTRDDGSAYKASKEKECYVILIMTEAAIMNRDVGETSAVEFCGTVSKAEYSAQTVSR